MTALAANKNIQRKHEGMVASYPVAASTVIYKGGLVAVNTSGYAVPAADTAAFRVVGICQDKADNSSGAAGAIEVKVESGIQALLTAVSITQAMVGKKMYVTDDATVDDISSVTNKVAVGYLTRYVSATSGWVFIPYGGMPPDPVTASTINVTLVAGGSAGAHTVTGIAVGDDILFVGHFSTAASIATLADLTSEFSVSAADEIDNTDGTDTTSDQLMVIWADRT